MGLLVDDLLAFPGWGKHEILKKQLLIPKAMVKEIIDDRSIQKEYDNNIKMEYCCIRL